MCRHEEASDGEGWEAVVTSSQQVDGAPHGFQSGGPQPERPKGTKISPSVKVTWKQAAAAAPEGQTRPERCISGWSFKNEFRDSRAD